MNERRIAADRCMLRVSGDYSQLLEGQRAGSGKNGAVPSFNSRWPEILRRAPHCRRTSFAPSAGDSSDSAALSPTKHNARTHTPSRSRWRWSLKSELHSFTGFSPPRTPFCQATGWTLSVHSLASTDVHGGSQAGKGRNIQTAMLAAGAGVRWLPLRNRLKEPRRFRLFWLVCALHSGNFLPFRSFVFLFPFFFCCFSFFLFFFSHGSLQSRGRSNGLWDASAAVQKAACRRQTIALPAPPMAALPHADVRRAPASRLRLPMTSRNTCEGLRFLRFFTNRHGFPSAELGSEPAVLRAVSAQRSNGANV